MFMTQQFPHTEVFIVRDYELDSQGVVNNANYLHYLEHARHNFLKSIGVNVVELHNQGFTLVVMRYEIDYKASLYGGDEFSVATRAEQISPLKLCFTHQIQRLSDQKVILCAKAIGTCIDQQANRPGLPDLLRRTLSSLEASLI